MRFRGFRCPHTVFVARPHTRLYIRMCQGIALAVAHRWRARWKKILRHFPDEEAYMSGRRAFGSIRKGRSGRFEVRYTGPDGCKYTAGRTLTPTSSGTLRPGSSARIGHPDCRSIRTVSVGPGSERGRLPASRGPSSMTCDIRASRSSHSRARRSPSFSTGADTVTLMSLCAISTRLASATQLCRHAWTRMC